MFDLTKWFIMQAHDPSKFHLEGLNLAGKKVIQCQYDDGRNLWFTKTLNGFPWDVKPYDTQAIYDRVTELDWNSPRDFKQFNPPLAMCPRYWDGDVTGTIYHPTSNYEVWINCQKVGNPSNVNTVGYTIDGPRFIDFGGDVRSVATIIISYYWSNGHDREQLYLCQEFGWVKWTHATMQTTPMPFPVYQVDAASVHNKLVAGGGAPIQFPCLKL